MKIRMKKYLALMMAIAIVLPVSNVTVDAAHTHSYSYVGNVTESIGFYDQNYHQIEYTLYYRCSCGDTYTTPSTKYANHKFDKGVCSMCGYEK